MAAVTNLPTSATPHLPNKLCSCRAVPMKPCGQPQEDNMGHGSNGGMAATMCELPLNPVLLRPVLPSHGQPHGSMSTALWAQLHGHTAM